MQASSIAFLTDHGFDFSRIFRDGISWLNVSEERRLRALLKPILQRRNVFKKEKHSKEQLCPEASKALDELETNVMQWVTATPCPMQLKPGESFPVRTFQLHKDLPPRFALCMLREKFPLVASSSHKWQGREVVFATICSSYEAVEEQKAKDLDKTLDYIVSSHVSLRFIIDELRRHNVPIVFHNALMDLSKVYANFVDDLPPTLVEFKCKLKGAFPCIYDTRYIINNLEKSSEWSFLRGERFRTTLLDYVENMRTVAERRGISEALSVNTFIPSNNMHHDRAGADSEFVSGIKGYEIGEHNADWEINTSSFFDFTKYLPRDDGSDRNLMHEAGYDALQTGKCFILLQALINDNNLMDSMRNKVPLSVCGGYNHINLSTSGSEENLWFDRDVVVVAAAPNDENGPDSRYKSIVHKLTAGSVFDASLSHVFTVNRMENKFIVALYAEDKGNKGDGNGVTGKPTLLSAPLEVNKVIERGRELGFSVTPYKPEFLNPEETQTTYDLKRRRT